jgi:hypothetical protein
MFRALFVHPQDLLHKRHLVYYVRIMSDGCCTVAVSLQSCNSHLTYAHNIPNSVCAGHPEYEEVMLEICRVLLFSIN